MRKMILASAFLLLVSGSQANAQSHSDAVAIKQTALDYIEGWYEGNAERMERALHPELAKRIVRTNPEGNSRLFSHFSFSFLPFFRTHSGHSSAPSYEEIQPTRIRFS